MSQRVDSVSDLLVEIGTEEIPASYLLPACDQLHRDFETFLSENGLSCRRIRTFYTPRRLALLAEKVPSRQQDKALRILGPPAKVCFDEDGTPTKTLSGFAKSQRIRPSQVRITETEKGEYVCVDKTERGRATTSVLKEFLPELVANLTFPKTMRWTEANFRFARPLRWIAALYGPRVVNFAVAGIRSSKNTRGHRFLSPGRISLTEPRDYLACLRKAYVIADPAERLSKIVTSITEAASEAGGRPVVDDRLLSEVNNLVEYPLSVLGSFDRTYLRLPRDVVLTAMRVHQRYFGVADRRGRLLPNFIAVVTGDRKHLPIILDGNERVLRARLADALFYWDTDRKVPLGERVSSLKSVVWLEGMGSLYQKGERLESLGAHIASLLDFEGVDVVKRAARLAKADLVTSMIKDGKEFTTLEGRIGMEYALQSGESKDVATAIHEHYLPRFPGDSVPRTTPGIILSVADKLDTIVGGFLSGYTPTGSQDPQGLRRAAGAVVSLLGEKKISLDLVSLVDTTLEAFKKQKLLKAKDIKDEVLQFLQGRIRSWLEEIGFKYDLVDAVVQARCDDPTDALMRARALKALQDSAGFVHLVAAQKRVANILKDAASPGPLHESLLTDRYEIRLFRAVEKLRPAFDKSVVHKDYRKALKHLLSLRKPIDELFDRVLIMSPEEEIRKNRFALLLSTRELFRQIADLSRIVLE